VLEAREICAFEREARRLAAEAERREKLLPSGSAADEVARHAADKIERQAAEKGRAEARALRGLQGQSEKLDHDARYLSSLGR
jgi:hypothetical protein